MRVTDMSTEELRYATGYDVQYLGTRTVAFFADLRVRSTSVDRGKVHAASRPARSLRLRVHLNGPSALRHIGIFHVLPGPVVSGPPSVTNQTGLRYHQQLVAASASIVLFNRGLLRVEISDVGKCNGES
jgi:hypothetical protein